jgi:hypothetical protein
MNELVMTMNEAVQKKETTVVHVQVLATQWATQWATKVCKIKKAVRTKMSIDLLSLYYKVKNGY